MTDLQEDKLSMYFAVETAADRHAAVIAGLPAFATNYAAFAAEVTTIRGLVDDQVTGIAGATQAKANARQAMAELAYPTAAAVRAWATITGDLQLADRVGFTMSDLLYGRDSIAEERAQLIHDEAQTNIASLADYGVDAAGQTALATTITDYHTELMAPREAITDRKAATSALKVSFTETDQILKTVLDKLVPILALSNPAFATDWWNSRNIYDSGGNPGGGNGGNGGGGDSESSGSESSFSSEDFPSSSSSLFSSSSSWSSSSSSSSSSFFSSSSSSF